VTECDGLRGLPGSRHMAASQQGATMFSLSTRHRSVLYAVRGLGFALKTQANFRIQVVAAMTCVILGVTWRVSADDWRWLVLAVAIVLITEAINTAVEHLCDVVQPEPHASVKAAKDVAAGAVLMASIASAVIGILVFWPYVADLIWPPLS
jgi:diacylglycerol kinase (ATP)